MSMSSTRDIRDRSLTTLSPPSLSMKRLIGYDSESQEHNPETLHHYIYGGHVADYMRHLMEEDEEKYKSHFSRFIKEGITADNVSCYTARLGMSCDCYSCHVTFTCVV